MWQERIIGRQFWQEIQEEEMRQKLARQFSNQDDIERVITGMLKGETHLCQYEYFRYWPEGKMGNPSL